MAYLASLGTQTKADSMARSKRRKFLSLLLHTRDFLSSVRFEIFAFDASQLPLNPLRLRPTGTSTLQSVKMERAIPQPPNFNARGLVTLVRCHPYKFNFAIVHITFSSCCL